MAETFQFELVTPERLALSIEVEMVEVPGEMGDFGVLAGHAPFLSMIRPGVITIHETGGVTSRYFVPSGYAEVNPESCIVLAETAQNLAEIDVATINAQVEAAATALQQTQSEAEQLYAEKTLRVAKALLLAKTGQ